MNRGFTLIEMLVSVAIFTVVMVIAIGALLAMSEADRRAEALNSSINNLNFAVDSMSRVMRTGYSYYCGANQGSPATRDCTGGGASMSLSIVDGSLAGCTAGVPCPVTYCLGSGSLCSSQTTCQTSLCSILRDVNNQGYQPLTAPEVNVQSLIFYVTGAADSPSTLQPKATILVSGTVPVTPTQTSAFHLETSVTQRLYDQ